MQPPHHFSVPASLETLLTSAFVVGLPALVFGGLVWVVSAFAKNRVRWAPLASAVTALGLLIFVAFVGILWTIEFALRPRGGSVDWDAYRTAKLVARLALVAGYVGCVGATYGLGRWLGRRSGPDGQRIGVWSASLVLTFLVLSLGWVEHWNNCWFGESLFLPPEDCG